MKERILVIEDERPMRTALADLLEAEGYRVIMANDGAMGLDKALREKPDLLLLDVMMPKLDGFALCAEVRKSNANIPILFLTAKGMVRDRVAGLNAGGDDYLLKPFSSEELIARVEALLRRVRRGLSAPVALQILQIGEARVDFASRTAERAGKPLHFTAKEFAMLRLMAENEGRPVSREQFLDIVWGYGAFPTTRTVDNHIASLRAKIELEPEKPRHLITVHGVGYKLANFTELCNSMTTPAASSAKFSS